MKKMELKVGAGDMFSKVAEKAKNIMLAGKDLEGQLDFVEFNFNGVLCKVNKNTNLDWLERDYSNSWDAGWEEVGPDCVESYPDEVQKMIDETAKKNEEQAELRRKEIEREDNAKRDLVIKSVAGINLEIIEGKEDEYAKYVETNSKDGYSRGVVDYAEYWAKLMQKEITNGKKVHEIADECQNNLGFLGITGFMYGCAVQALAHFWKHGEDLRKWHNKEYGVSEDKEGVVNPAIMTINI